jgi:hypothetical protein
MDVSRLPVFAAGLEDKRQFAERRKVGVSCHADIGGKRPVRLRAAINGKLPFVQRAAVGANCRIGWKADMALFFGDNAATSTTASVEGSCAMSGAYYRGKTVMIGGEAFERFILGIAIGIALVVHPVAGDIAACRRPDLCSLSGCQGSPGARAVPMRAHEGATRLPTAG